MTGVSVFLAFLFLALSFADGADKSQCPASHPNVYYNGHYCCNSNKEQFSYLQGNKCDGSVIQRDSLCCAGVSVQCPSGTCSQASVLTLGMHYSSAERGDRTLSISGPVEDLTQRNFNNIASRYKIDGNGKWEFYDGPNFGGRLLFTATGPVGWTRIENVAYAAKHNDAVSSVRPVSGSTPTKKTCKRVSRGCWWAGAISGGVRLNSDHNPIEECQKYAVQKEYSFFAVQSYTQCVTSGDAGNTYKRYGQSNNCYSGYGRGGPSAYTVYQIVCEDPPSGGDTGPDGFCKLPPHVTRRAVAIWTPDMMKPVTKSSCPQDYPYSMYGGSWCCYINNWVQYKQEYANSNYYNCDANICCSKSGHDLIRCPHDSGYGCLNSASFWQLPTNYNSLYGDTKNIGTSNHDLYGYDNVNGIDLLKEGDYVVLNCDNEYKAFGCDDPDEDWSKDCSDQTEDLKTNEVNFFVPHHKSLENARAYCQSQGGNLATIRSEVDNLLAVKVMLMRGASQQCAFIGFTDEAISGIWKWMNGKDVTYTNWAYHKTSKGWDQPNDGFGYGEEDYTVMCRYPDSNQNLKNEFKWFDVGPPRNYFQNDKVNFELAYSFCTVSANFKGTEKGCPRPLRPCGGVYVKRSNTKIIAHGTYHSIECYTGYRMIGEGKISCHNGVASRIPQCIQVNIQYGTGLQLEEGDDDVPRTFSFDDYDAAGDMRVRNTKDCFGDSDKDEPITDIVYYITTEDGVGDSGGSDDEGDSIPRGFFDD